jgi:hypothetical protein
LNQSTILLYHANADLSRGKLKFVTLTKKPDAQHGICIKMLHPAGNATLWSVRTESTGLSGQDAENRGKCGKMKAPPVQVKKSVLY